MANGADAASVLAYAAWLAQARLSSRATPLPGDPLGPLLPQQAATGRPAVEHRLIVEGILWVMRTGSAWRELPARFGPWQTVVSRYQRWRKEGRWARMLQVLQQPAEMPITSSA